MRLDRGAWSGAPGIAHRGRSRLQQRRVHHVCQLILIFGNHVDDVGNATQIADVEKTVMRRSIIAGKPAAIHAEDDRQVLQANIVHDGIEGTLQESGVNGTERTEAHGGQAGGKDDAVLLGDAHIEIPARVMRTEEVERRSVGHGGGDGHDLGVLVGQLDQGLGKDFGIGTLPRRCGLAGIRVVGAKAVKLLLLVERRLKAASLLRNGVQQDRPLLGFQELKCFDQQTDVVAIERAVIREPKLLKEHGRPQHALGGFFRLAHHLPGGLAAQLFQQAGRGIVQIGVALVGDNLVQVVGDRAHIAVDRPLVVVQHHDQALGLLGDIVERLKTYAIGERRIPGEGNHVLFGRRPDRAPPPCPGQRRAQCRRGPRRSNHDRFPCAARSRSGRPAGAWCLKRSRRPVSSL